MDWWSQSNPWITENAAVAESYWGAVGPLHVVGYGGGGGAGGTGSGGVLGSGTVLGGSGGVSGSLGACGPVGEFSIRRVKRWSFSFQELLKDPLGRAKFRQWLEKEFAAENLMFWQECQVNYPPFLWLAKML